MSDTPATQPKRTLAEVLHGSTKRLADVLPPHIEPKRVIRMALLAAHKNPAILRCSEESVVFSVMQIASWGLEIGRTAHLVPYGNTCQPIPDYKGLVQMAIQSGEVMKADARVVREGDAFDYEYGLDEKLEHKPEPGNERPVTFAYAILSLPGGDKKFEVMSAAEIDAIRARSRAGNAGPWKTDYAEMAKKTVLKRIFKMVPLSERLQEAIEADNTEYAPDAPAERPASPPAERGRSQRLAALQAPQPDPLAGLTKEREVQPATADADPLGDDPLGD